MINAWMPGTARYVTCKLELAAIASDVFNQWTPWLLGYVTDQLGGEPDEWRWELDGDVVELTAARATC